jgi:DNA polymerase III alpha subunit
MSALLASRKNFLLDMKNYSLSRTGGMSTIPKLHRALLPLQGKEGIDIYDYEKIFADEKTKKLMREGRTIGCFYIESPGMRSLLQKLSCETFEMLTAASSVIRPGVASSGMMSEFVTRHKNPSRREYLIPEMEKYLGETYGVMIYQEDVIKVAHHVAGLTLEEADLLRRAMSGKMRSHEAMLKIKNRFFNSCRFKGLSEKATRELWRQIESFAGYAFSKAHSASFALLSFQVAYLKAHYPAEFMANVLNNGGGYYLPGVYINEAKRMGIRILLPSVNRSSYEYIGFDKMIRMGFKAIKNLSEKTAKKIVRERKTGGKYLDLKDFLERTDIGYEEAELLIKCGALDCFGKTRPTLLRLLDIYSHYKRSLILYGKNLFGNEVANLEKKIETKRQYTIEEICITEYETFGFMVSRHPINFFEDKMKKLNAISASEMSLYAGRSVKMIGWFVSSKRLRTKNGQIMKFLSLEDLSGTFEAVIFPNVYRRVATKTLSMGPFLIAGKIDEENTNNIVVENLEILPFIASKMNIGKDSAENEYFGDVEKVTEAESGIVNSLGNKLRKAYLR